MSLWQRPIDLQAINAAHDNTLMETLGIEITHVTDSALYGTLPVDGRTRQPQGLLHGGASVALAETLGSVAANLATPPGWVAVGMEISASHLRPVRHGQILGCARPLHRGRSTQVWDIQLEDEAGTVICVCRLTVLLKEKNPV
ncbi:1,4-dihydroxy-2-naphthoyl-CoA hydrolase [Ectothiorhodospira magna]|uniref:1,4-dihydroxy-2-naphthoyl-CoA hydrolase n=1 Tax=Ectothiorhodospira magna TaxID=867345 RepID=A0A1H9FDN6_9GAMM|nr:hotdog fold thioesterase [Ectothiorhodospira magna]SEQ36050.1 1,4-dihydroxy-2-naphthoyl-CoA hydrolase [Ectothiorhodospira magna]